MHFELQVNELSQEEMMLFAFKSPYDAFFNIQEYFTPYYQMGALAQEVTGKKRQWQETVIRDLENKEVRNLIENG